MPIEEYVLGEPVKIRGFFFDDLEEEDPVNPGTVTLIVQDPEGTDTTYDDTTIENEELGYFWQVVDTEVAGDWQYRWETLSPKQVIQGMFTVYDRNV